MPLIVLLFMISGIAFFFGQEIQKNEGSFGKVERVLFSVAMYSVYVGTAALGLAYLIK
jgi:hypothetical protein